MKHLIQRSALLCLVFVLGACDDPSSSEIAPAVELISSVDVRLVDSANIADTVYATFTDPDGPAGPDGPLIFGATIKPGRTYLGRIDLWQLVRAEGDDDTLAKISEEIEELGTQHQFFYTVTGDDPSAISIEITDRDANNRPLGLEFKLRTAQVSGMIHDVLNVVLSHYEEPGLKNGVDRSDESDIDIDFPVMIQ